MQATIITIGDEILIGQIVDTNASLIARELSAVGVRVVRRSSVGDQAEAIAGELKGALAVSDVVILTGGLGPTKDDITKKTLAAFFGMGMRYDSGVADHVFNLLSARGVAFNALNRSQAEVPDGAEVLPNAHGTAPGMWFALPGKAVISLPGVPFEMKHLMREQVLPRLRERFALKSAIHRTMITAGLAESLLAERIAEWENALPEYLHLAYLPAPGKVRLRLSAYEVSEKVSEEVDARFTALRQLIPQYFVGFEGATVEQLVHDELLSRKQTLSTAESCTGGRIAAAFTAMPGSSGYYKGGMIAYSNSLKQELLGVSTRDLDDFGAVSEQVVRAMAEGARSKCRSDWALATSGIAGPAGGTEEKPVGTVWIACAGPSGTATLKIHAGTDRGQIQDRATAAAIALLREQFGH